MYFHEFCSKEKNKPTFYSKVFLIKRSKENTSHHHLLIPFLENTTCKAGQFQCKKTRRCIPEKWKCDNDNDCLDNSDEVGCPVVRTCGNDSFQCVTNQNCIPKKWRCDGHKDCHDESDEKNCSKYCSLDVLCIVMLYDNLITLFLLWWTFFLSIISSFYRWWKL